MSNEKSFGISEPELIKNKGEITKEQQLENYKKLLELKIDLPFDIESVDPYCHACVLSQLKKYEKFHSEHSGSAENKFSIPCKGIPLESVPQQLKSGFTEKEWEELEAQSNIVKWAEKYLKDNTGKPWTARWYQSKTLECSSRRKSLRISRRSGKTTLVCVEICYYLFTHPGIKLIVAGPQKAQTEEIINRVKEFIACNPSLQECVTRCVAAPYYKIELSNKSELRGFAAGDDGKSIRGQDADRIYCFPEGTLVNTSKFGVKPIEKLTLKDTVLGGDNNGVYVGEIQALGKRQETLVTIPTDLNIVKCTPDHPLFNGEKDVEAKDATEVICSLYHKELSFSYEVIRARLLGFIYGDGWVSNGSIGFAGQIDDLEQIQEDMSLLGDRKHKCTERITENKKRGIKGKGAQLNSTYIYPFLKDFLPEGKRVYQPIRVPSIIMNGMDYIKSNFLSGLFSAEATGITYQKNGISPHVIRLKMFSSKREWLLNWFSDLGQLLEDLNIQYSFRERYQKEDKINKERFIGEISIKSSKTNIDKFAHRIGYCYCARKTRTINEWKLYRKYEERYFQDNWIKNRAIHGMSKSSAEYISKVLNIPKSTVKYHRRLNDELYSKRKIKVKDYIQKLTWKDGYVKLPINKNNVRFSTEKVDVYNLTSGAANRFFAGGYFTHNCEEAQFVPEKAFVDAVLPILQTHPDTSLIAFSTPNAMVTTFYKLCKQNPAVKETHYTYRVLPHRKSVEADRNNYTEEQWDGEFEASFGSSSDGVYKVQYVDDAAQKYNYEDHSPQQGWRYIIGTDWNEKYGAEIYVVGWSPFDKRFHGVESIHVESTQFTQLTAVSKFLEMVTKWNPNFSYVDLGNGSSNVELILKKALQARKTGTQPEIAKLVTTLKTYDSGAKIEIKDPTTGEKVRKPAKPFMINASVRTLEQGRFYFPASDKKLEAQFKNYIIDRYTPTGNPVYGQNDPKIGDHRLDALNLALVGFHIEFDDLYKIDLPNIISYSLPDPRKKQLDQKENGKPKDRRLQSGDILSLDNFFSIPGRAKSSNIKTNRLGWHTDREEIEMERYLTKRRNNTRRGNLPQRTNF